MDVSALHQSFRSTFGLNSDFLAFVLLWSWISCQAQEAQSSGIAFNHLLEEFEDALGLELEGSRVLSLSHHVLLESLKGYHKLTDETSKGVDAGSKVGTVVSDIVDGQGNGVLSLLGRLQSLSCQHFLELVQAELLFEAPAALMASFLRTSSLFRLAPLRVLVVLSALHLSLDGLLVPESVADQADLQSVLDRSISVAVFQDLQLDLLV